MRSATSSKQNVVGGFGRPFCGYVVPDTKAQMLIVTDVTEMDPEEEEPNFDTITINISGKRFETCLRTLERFPETRLGNPMLRKKYYNKTREEYFFDRNQEAFHAILYYYQSRGSLYIPPAIQEQVFYQELDFWGINPEPRGGENGFALIDDTDHKKPPHEFRWGKLQKTTYVFLNKPKSSFGARIWASVDIFVILCSVINLVVESYGNKNRSPGDTDTPYFAVDAACVCFFSVDIVLRCLVAPDMARFFKKPLNWFDFLAIMPFYLELSLGGFMRTGAMNNNIIMPFKILRIFRITRVLKLIRHSGRLILMIQVLLDCVYELAMLLVIWLMGVFIFGTIMFYIEHEQKDTKFESIMHSCWWSVVSMSTVGYGDMYPETWAGKLVASILVFVSMIFLALPMTIIVSKFNKAFEKFSPENEKRQQAQQAAQQAAKQAQEQRNAGYQQVEKDQITNTQT
ncbi:potassium voltage-gated channel subfamily A member 2-like isoform X4 [Bolinopsis microptera]|uniref:potassium voltage-gated channel subfamily A member 2-like isoform X4 n=1 Tax=Bolinopsis microptera TaxID=2820187 RepID=UPI003079BF83